MPSSLPAPSAKPQQLRPAELPPGSANLRAPRLPSNLQGAAAQMKDVPIRDATRPSDSLLRAPRIPPAPTPPRIEIASQRMAPPVASPVAPTEQWPPAGPSSRGHRNPADSGTVRSELVAGRRPAEAGPSDQPGPTAGDRAAGLPAWLSILLGFLIGLTVLWWGGAL